DARDLLFRDGCWKEDHVFEAGIAEQSALRLLLKNTGNAKGNALDNDGLSDGAALPENGVALFFGDYAQALLSISVCEEPAFSQRLRPHLEPLWSRRNDKSAMGLAVLIDSATDENKGRYAIYGFQPAQFLNVAFGQCRD